MKSNELTNSVNIDSEEKKRIQTLLQYEMEARSKGFTLIAGIDEAGRGPLAGPVVAAACIIPEGIYIPQVNDSKKLTPKIRELVFQMIIDNPRIIYGIGIIDSLTIDRINIYQATIQAMLMAVERLAVKPDCLLVDGMQLPHSDITVTKIIKGDQKSQSIAAASILAKVTRDRLMEEYHLQWSCYGFDKHKGYGTAYHMDAISKYGACPIHRLTFEPMKGGKYNI